MRKCVPWAIVALLVGCGGEPSGPAAVASVTVTPGTDTLTALGQTRQFNAVARDAAGTPIPGKTFTWSSQTPGVATVDPATGLVTAVGNGGAAIVATVDGKTGQAAVTVAQDVATVTVAPATFVLTAIDATQPFTAVARDANASVVAGVKFLWLSSDQSVATVDTTGLARGRGPGATTITAAARGVPGNAQLTVNQTALELAVTVEPTGTVAGEALSPAVEVEVRDANGRLVTSARNTVTIGFANNPTGGTLHGTTTVNANGGIASFSGLWVDKVAAGYTLVATSGGLADAVTAAFVISPAAPERLVYLSPPHTDSAGVDLGVEVALYDHFGNLAAAATNAVSLVLTNAPLGGQLFGTADAVPTNGVALFPGLNIHLAGFPYVIRARAAGLDSVESLPFRIDPAEAAQLAFLTYPSPVLANLNNSSDRFVRVEVRDAFGNRQPLPPRPVTVEIGANPWRGATGPGGTLAGTTTVTTGAGVAIFGDLQIDKPGVGYTLVAASVGLDSATTAPIAVKLGLTSLLAVGQAHSCIVNESGTYCWGDNSAGQLGGLTGATASDSVALHVPGGTFTRIAAGGRHTCGIASGAAYCWGANDHGQLGLGVFGGAEPLPVPVTGGVQFLEIAAGDAHTCAVAVDNRVFCWGDNRAGQLGDSTHIDRSAPTILYGGGLYAQVALGLEHGCASAGGLIRCWGGNSFGQLGNGTSLPSDTPQVVSNVGGLIAAGDSHSCALRQFGNVDSIACWGRNGDGQLGDGNVGTDSPSPVMAVGLAIDLTQPGTALSFSAGRAHTCFGRNGTNFCWGSNGSGQLGNTAIVGFSDVPVPVEVAVPFGYFAGGGDHTCGFYFFGSSATGVHCWGANGSGQVGDGSTINRLVPTPIVQ